MNCFLLLLSNKPALDLHMDMGAGLSDSKLVLSNLSRLSESELLHHLCTITEKLRFCFVFIKGICDN